PRGVPPEAVGPPGRAASPGAATGPRPAARGRGRPRGGARPGPGGAAVAPRGIPPAADPPLHRRGGLRNHRNPARPVERLAAGAVAPRAETAAHAARPRVRPRADVEEHEAREL